MQPLCQNDRAHRLPCHSLNGYGRQPAYQVTTE